MYTDPVTRTVTDDDNDLICVSITAEWPGSQRESVYLSRAGGEQVTSGLFGTRYTGVSNARAAVTDGFAYTFLRDGNWPAATLMIRTVAVDATGNITTDETTYSIARPTTATSASSSATATVEPSRCLLVDPTTGDISHDGVTLQLVSGIDAIAQSLRTRLAFFQGEWFLDEGYGTPYFQTILGKQVPLQAVREVFRQIIADTDGVLDITKLELTAGSAPRSFVLGFTCSTDLGALTLSVPTGV